MSENPPDRRVTQLDIARAIGVSNATISLALRDSDEIPQARREEIQAAAARMGYRPNSAATELVRHRRASTVMPVHASLAWINT